MLSSLFLSSNSFFRGLTGLPPKLSRGLGAGTVCVVVGCVIFSGEFFGEVVVGRDENVSFF